MKTYSIRNWLGLNEGVAETEILPGQAVRCKNYRITKDYKVQKRPGHNTWWDFENTKPVQGVWYGEYNGETILVACNDGKAYKRKVSMETTETRNSYLMSENIVELMGELTDAPTSIFYFQGILYFQNGTDYKEYRYVPEIELPLHDVVPYAPLIKTDTNPSTDEGLIYEPINLLTGKKRKGFIGDGTTTVYKLGEENIDDDLVVIEVDGSIMEEHTNFEVDRLNGEIYWTEGSSPMGAPADGSIVIPLWSKGDGNADLVKKNKFNMLFGPGNDTAVFMWGNPNRPNTRIWSGTLDASYFPVTNQTNIGSDQYAITDIVSQSDSQIIYKEDRAYYSNPEWSDVTKAFDYPVRDLREDVGNIVPNGVQIIKNAPVTVYSRALWLWNSTNIEDERNADIISDRAKKTLSTDLSAAVTFDYQSETEYWLNISDTVLIYNYGNDTFYLYENIEGKCFLDIDGTLHYGSNGTVERMEGTDDNGVATEPQYELGVTAFGDISTIKNTSEVFIGFQPDAQTSLTLYYKTNKKNEYKAVHKPIEYRYLDFNNIDFDNFSFQTNTNPQVFRRPLRANRYNYIQFMLENKELGETCLILELNIPFETQGGI